MRSYANVLELDDMQGMLMSGYGQQPHAMYVFLELGDPAHARQWLRSVIPQVTSGEKEANRGRSRSLNLAFTCQGLAALGLGEATLDTFERPFREGMGQADRARIMGDLPENWQWGTPGHSISAILMLF